VQDAQAAVRELESMGISRDSISIVANKNAVGYDSMDAGDRDKASDIVADAGIGAAIGGVGGLLLAAAGAITLPVIGPILAAGPIAAALTGAGIGAAAGGLIGALTESGVPEDHAKYYAEGVRRGDVLVTVKTEAGHADRVCDILDRHNAIDVDDRVSSWKQRGWSGYSETASPLRDDEMREERQYYRATGSPGYRSDMPYDSTSSLGDAARETGHDMKRAWRDNVTDRDRDGRNDFSEAMDRDKDGRNDIGEGMRRMGDKVKDLGHRVANEGRELRDEARDNTQRVENDLRDEEYRRRRARVYDHIKY